MRPRGLCELPEVRVFFQQFCRAGPEGFFVADLGLPNVQSTTLSCLRSLRAFRRKGAASHRVAFDHQELAGLINDRTTLTQDGDFLAHRASREPFGQNDIQLEITFSSAPWRLQPLRERISDHALEPSQATGSP